VRARRVLTAQNGGFRPGQCVHDFDGFRYAQVPMKDDGTFSTAVFIARPLWCY
jgi:hypothetical protein